MDTIEILTEITRHHNDNDEEDKCLLKEPSKKRLVALNNSKAVTDSLKEYLDNLNKAVVSVVGHKEAPCANSDQEDEVSIQETLTLKQTSLKHFFVKFSLIFNYIKSFN